MVGQPQDQVQVDLSNAELMPEYMTSTGLPANLCQVGQQGMYDLPIKGLVMGGSALMQNGYQMEILNSSNA